jgi:glycosyltransferase involved in cell wall biosynthesis
MESPYLSKTTVSVIIPTKNEEHVILECLSSVFNQSLKPVEVIIVDGLSTDDTLKKALQFPVKVITEVEPTSLPSARNLGVEHAKGEVIFIMDADVILDKNCIKNAARYFEGANVMAVIPSEHDVSHSRLEKIQTEWLRGTANPFRTGIGISVFAEFIRKVVFEKIRFDPNLGFGEDEDFQQKLKRFCKHSGKIMYAHDSQISVHYSHRLNELWSQYTWYGRTFLRYLSKDPSLRMLLLLGSVLAPTIILALGFLSLFFVWALPFLVLFLVLLVTRNLIACYRSKCIHFFEFIGFEFLRSTFFVIGITQSFFSKKRGK